MTVVLLSIPATTWGQTADPNLWVTNGYVNTAWASGGILYIGGQFNHV